MTDTIPSTAPARGRATTALISVLILGLAGWTAWRLAPHEAAPQAPAGHQHGAAAPAADQAGPVQLGADEQRRIGITYAPVLSGPLAHSVRVVGQVTYDETRLVTVAPRVDGWVERLHADFTGRAVRAGEPLLTLYAPMVSSAAEELLLAERLAAQVAGGTPEAREQAERLVAAARERFRAWDLPADLVAEIERSGRAPHGIVLRAPASGVIVEKNVLQGQQVMAGSALYRIADLGVVWLEGEVFEQDLGVTRVGQEVTAEFQALPGESRTGQITYVYPTLDPETRTGRIRVALPNPGLRLKPGMFATMRFSPRVAGTVLSVPRSAVLSTGARNLVFLTRPDGRFTPTDVTLGLQTEDRLQVLAGVQPGDTVVASATFLLDAESNLGTLLGGMGDMPGMDMTAPGARMEPGAAPMRDMPGMPGMTPATPPAHDHHGQGD